LADLNKKPSNELEKVIGFIRGSKREEKKQLLLGRDYIKSEKGYKKFVNISKKNSKDETVRQLKLESIVP